MVEYRPYEYEAVEYKAEEYKTIDYVEFTRYAQAVQGENLRVNHLCSLLICYFSVCLIFQGRRWSTIN